MDPAYGRNFQNLYSTQSETGYLGQFRAAVAPDPQSIRDTESIRRLIDEAEANLTRSTTQTLRSDARYFLLLNLLQMVFLPFQLHTVHFPPGEFLATLALSPPEEHPPTSSPPCATI